MTRVTVPAAGTGRRSQPRVPHRLNAGAAADRAGAAALGRRRAYPHITALRCRYVRRPRLPGPHRPSSPPPALTCRRFRAGRFTAHAEMRARLLARGPIVRLWNLTHQVARY